jgi:hypothetical protein
VRPSLPPRQHDQPEEAGEAGISASGAPVAEPTIRRRPATPSGRAHASEDFAAYAASCLELLDVSPDRLREMNGIERLEPRGATVNDQALPFRCLDLEARVRNHGLYSGIDSPSFDCPPTATEAESAICYSEALWPHDRVMAAIYSRMRAELRPHDAEVLRNSQRGWLRARGECGYDEDCIVEVYKQRIVELIYW